MGDVKEDQDKKVYRYVQFYIYRTQKVSEQEIARRLGAESPTALYQALQRDGFPVCPICGATPEGLGHCGPPVAKRKRRARQGGEAIELPPAREARGLFREATQALSKIVDPPTPPIDHNGVTFRQMVDSVDLLGDLEEFLQGERFVSASVYRPNPDEIILRRGDFTEEGWIAACKDHGEDPSEDVILTDSVGVSPQGANQTPAKVLVKLIGAYVLAGLPLDPLLEKLHPEPEEADREQLNALIYGKPVNNGRRTEGMMDKVRQIARVVRGGKVRTGPPTEELSREELRAAWEIASWRNQGYHDDLIHHLLRHKGFSRSDVTRLGNLRPEKPDTNLQP